jgi:mRNA interferase YafQ
MRTIERTNVFKRDFKREKSGQHRRDLDALVFTTISRLAEDKPLPEKNRDHALGGEWRDHRECPLKPDLLLIYRKPNGGIATCPIGFPQRTLWLGWVSYFEPDGLN